MIVIKEEWISLAILHLVELEKCVVEGAGASGLAAILAGQLDELKNKKFAFPLFYLTKHNYIFSRVVLLLCGGNIDTNVFGRCLECGMAAKGRLLR